MFQPGSFPSCVRLQRAETESNTFNGNQIIHRLGRRNGCRSLFRGVATTPQRLVVYIWLRREASDPGSWSFYYFSCFSSLVFPRTASCCFCTLLLFLAFDCCSISAVTPYGSDVFGEEKRVTAASGLSAEMESVKRNSGRERDRGVKEPCDEQEGEKRSCCFDRKPPVCLFSLPPKVFFLLGKMQDLLHTTHAAFLTPSTLATAR